MKIALIVFGILALLFITFQIYTSMSVTKTETQPYTVIKDEGIFQVRYYPPATFAQITSKATTYKELGSSGFRQLAGYIFGGNKENKQIAMTSPVHMDIEKEGSTMAFVLPKEYSETNLPKPNNSNIVIKTTSAEYVAAIQFGGFANNETIDHYKSLLAESLKNKGILFKDSFRYLGYNPPYQLIGRKNEVIVSLDEKVVKTMYKLE